MIEIKELSVTDYNEMLENVCMTLWGYKMRNVEAFYEFEGVKITTKDISSPADIERLFQQIYGHSYSEHVKQKAILQKPAWLAQGFRLIDPIKQEEWVDFVNKTIEVIDFYHIGNPITDTLNLLIRINATEDRDQLKEIIISVDGSNNVLVRTAITFSNKGDIIQSIYDEIKQPELK